MSLEAYAHVCKFISFGISAPHCCIPGHPKPTKKKAIMTSKNPLVHRGIRKRYDLMERRLGMYAIAPLFDGCAMV